MAGEKVNIVRWIPHILTAIPIAIKFIHLSYSLIKFYNTPKEGAKNKAEVMLDMETAINALPFKVSAKTKELVLKFFDKFINWTVTWLNKRHGHDWPDKKGAQK